MANSLPARPCPSFLLSIETRTTSPSYSDKNLGRRESYSSKLWYFKGNLNTPFLDSLCRKRLLPPSSKNGHHSRNRTRKLPPVVSELGGHYDDTFNDVKIEIINYFTFKATRTVLEQLYEMNPPQYLWFYKFTANNSPSDGTRFLQSLVKESQELAERVMITRLTLYGRWIKKCDHGQIYKEISEENLKLLRDRLLETISWPPDDAPLDKK